MKLKNKKILLSCLAATAVSAPIAMVVACGDSTIGEKDIAMIISTRNNPYFVSLEAGAKAEAAEKGYKLHVFVSDNNQQTENSQVDNVITQGFKTLILNGLDSAQSAVSAKKAIDAGIKVIAVDRELDSTASVFTTISSANQDGAQRLTASVLTAMYALNTSNGWKPDVLHLQGISGEANGIQRWNGAKAAMLAQDSAYLTTNQWNIIEARADYDRTKGQTETGTAITGRSSINWIIADNDEMALGAIASLAGNAGTVAGKVFVTGFDGGADAVAAVKAGTLYGTVKQNATLLGGTAVQAAIEAGGGEDFTDIVINQATLVPVDVITSTNVADFE